MLSSTLLEQELHAELSLTAQLQELCQFTVSAGDLHTQQSLPLQAPLARGGKPCILVMRQTKQRLTTAQEHLGPWSGEGGRKAVMGWRSQKQQQS